MKRLFLLLTGMVSLFAGCQKYDDGDLWKEVNSQAERLTALERWQETVNGNITALQGLVTALQNNDYVTGVVPFTTPLPGGYRITFSKSSEATIWNGAKGDTGQQGQQGAPGSDAVAPVIGVKEFPAASGVYYWTLDDEFIEVSGAKMPVTGPKGNDGTPGASGTPGTPGTPGTTPTVEIISGYWWINGVDTGVKANGTDGTPGASGTPGTTPTVEIISDYWWINGVNTGVKATGTDGTDGTPGAPGTSGTNGVTPRVTIGSDGYWYISADGTGTGTPPDVSTGNWTQGVKATGDTGATGAQGPQGDAIFDANAGVTQDDNSVTFTLANGGGTITLPKYKTLGITFDQPGVFENGQPLTITYTSTGSVDPTHIRVVDVPAMWKVTVNVADKTITVTPPAIDALVRGGEATLLVGDGGERTIFLPLILNNEQIAGNLVGSVYYENGLKAGIVYVANTGPGTGRVVSLDQTPGTLAWANFYANIGTTSQADGLLNMAAVVTYMSANSKTWSDFPAFKFANDKNPAGTTYASGQTGVWYLPARNELGDSDGGLYRVWNGGSGSTEVSGGRTTFNDYLIGAGGTVIQPSPSYYWSSSESGSFSAWYVDFNTGNQNLISKDYTLNLVARAALAF